MTFSSELGSCCCSQYTSERRMNGCWQGLSSLVIPLLRLSTSLKTKASLVLCSGNGKGAPQPPLSPDLKSELFCISRICLWPRSVSTQKKSKTRWLQTLFPGSLQGCLSRDVLIFKLNEVCKMREERSKESWMGQSWGIFRCTELWSSEFFLSVFAGNLFYFFK